MNIMNNLNKSEFKSNKRQRKKSILATLCFLMGALELYVFFSNKFAPNK